VVWEKRVGTGREGRGTFISTEAELQPDFCGIQKEERRRTIIIGERSLLILKGVGPSPGYYLGFSRICVVR
jgi:hypothetical protein